MTTINNSGHYGYLGGNYLSVMPPTAVRDDVVNLLGELGCTNHSFTDVNMLATLCLRLAQLMRNSSRVIRREELDAQVQLLLRSADFMRDAAEMHRLAAITKGILDIASGLATAGCSPFVGRGNMQVSNAWNGFGQGVSGSMNGIGTIGSAGLNFHADMADAEAKTTEAHAREREQGQADASELMQQMLDLIRNMIGVLQGAEQSRSEGNREIVRHF